MYYLNKTCYEIYIDYQINNVIDAFKYLIH